MAGSDDSLEYLDSQEENSNDIKGNKYDETVQKLINELEGSEDSIDSLNSTENMDVTIIEPKDKEPGEKSPEKFVSSYVTDEHGAQHMTLSLPPSVMTNLLDYNTNNFSGNASLNPLSQTGGEVNAQGGGGSSSLQSGYTPLPSVPILGSHVDMSTVTLKKTGTINKTYP